MITIGAQGLINLSKVFHLFAAIQDFQAIFLITEYMHALLTGLLIIVFYGNR